MQIYTLHTLRMQIHIPEDVRLLTKKKYFHVEFKEASKILLIKFCPWILEF